LSGAYREAAVESIHHLALISPESKPKKGSDHPIGNERGGTRDARAVHKKRAGTEAPLESKKKIHEEGREGRHGGPYTERVATQSNKFWKGGVNCA